ncbi:MAG: FeoB-associated Cys-rich membrane protein [Clostridiales bacterium]|nr:FeoB-associated Cys-rich membrane protein [Clostridiales bacterium]
MGDIIVVLILIAIVAGIIRYLIRAKKRGEACIGCPYAKKCMGKCGGELSSASNTSDREEFKN